jgi:tetratricopeptide (TPR) repeat protein
MSRGRQRKRRHFKIGKRLPSFRLQRTFGAAKVAARSNLLEQVTTMKIFRFFALAALLSCTLLPGLTRAENKAEAYKYTKEGIEAAKNKEWDKAIENFKKAVAADPKEADNHNNLGLAYKGAGKLDDAVKAFSDAIEAEPNNAAGYINRAVVYTSQNKYDQAIGDLDKAIQLKSDSVPARRYRAFAYLQKKEYKKAIDDYDIVLKEKSDNEILEHRAFAFWNLKEYDKAIADYTRIIKDKPNEKQGYLDRSYVYELKGDYANGIADCDKALSIDPKDEDAKSRKVRLEYKKTGGSTPTPTARPRRTLPPEETPTRSKPKPATPPGTTR